MSFEWDILLFMDRTAFLSSRKCSKMIFGRKVIEKVREKSFCASIHQIFSCKAWINTEHFWEVTCLHHSQSYFMRSHCLSILGCQMIQILWKYQYMPFNERAGSTNTIHLWEDKFLKRKSLKERPSPPKELSVPCQWPISAWCTISPIYLLLTSKTFSFHWALGQKLGKLLMVPGELDFLRHLLILLELTLHDKLYILTW